MIGRTTRRVATALAGTAAVATLLGLGADRTGPVVVLVAAWWVAVVAAWPAHRAGWTAAATAAALTATTWAPRLHLHAAKGYDLLVTIGIPQSPARLYGGGWPAMQAVGGFALGWPADSHALVGAALGVVAAVLAADAAHRRLGPGPGLAAGIAVATLPVARALATAPDRATLTTAALVAAVAGIARADRTGDALAVLSAGLLATARPEHVPTAAGVAVVLAMVRGAAPGAAATGLVLARAAVLGAALWAGGSAAGLPWRTPVPSNPAMWVFTRDAALLLADPHRVPAVLGAGVFAGLALARGATRRDLALALALGVLALSVQPLQSLAPDRIRLQLPGTVLLAATGGAGLVVVLRAMPPGAQRVVGVVTAVAAALGLAAARAPFHPAYPWHIEHVLLDEVSRTLPEDAFVVMPDRPDRASQARWASARGPSVWRVRGGALPAGSLLWIGTLDQTRDAPPVPWDALVPVHAVRVSGYDRGTDILPGLPEPLHLGLFRTTRAIVLPGDAP